MKKITIIIEDDSRRLNRSVEIDGKFQYSEHIPHEASDSEKETEIAKFIRWVQSKADEGFPSTKTTPTPA